MSWATPTITHRRGRVIRHTQIVCVGTMEGSTPYRLNIPNLPWGIYAGMIQIRSDGGTAADISSFRLGTNGVTVSGVDSSQYMNVQDLTLVTDPDYFPITSIFEQIAAPNTSNEIGAIGLPTNELWLFGNSDGVSVTETLTVYIGLISHVLDQ